ncbi:tyrosinase cofactor [Streptomyces sp. NPDC051207]|uniref:tyrosinase cofactor n=1 Tax=Streptomyces sp. NPDC051207 TaxID=3154641 RepID=UPI003425B516
MVVSDGAAADNAGHGPEDPGGTEPGRGGGGTRRGVVRGLLASAVAAALTPVLAASRPPATAAEDHGGPWDTAFDEMYRGRRIRGVRSLEGRLAGAGVWRVTVDGRPLHLMRRADGTWLTMVDHYRSYPTPLEAARAAVDEMGPGRRLRDTGTGHGHEGGHHGVHP